MRESDRSLGGAHRHYEFWFVGNGSQTEFLIAERDALGNVVRTRTYGRPEDVAVFVNGSRYRPDDRGTGQDYQIRGITPGYLGERNAIKFAVAPPVNYDVCVMIISA